MCSQLAPTHSQLSSTLVPLRELLRKDAVFNFGEPQVEAFNKAKEVSTSHSVIAYYRPGATIDMYTNASSLNGLGFIVRQKQPDGSWKLIQAGSRSLLSAEKNFAPIQLELSGIVWACKRARTFLAGVSHFTLYTDQKPLVSILNNRRMDEIKNQRMNDFMIDLKDFHFTW